ncbi:MAG: glycoside hydrolase family 99-like domain-containing protein [Verrucomicrobiales bacterium]|nr:glycoside hydrolase family 99-like domain-containing protein [Verrucomicrobiales bacterium]
MMSTPAGHAPHAPGGPARLIALYLPQFHPIPENDAWWGKGFTEWTNVTRAQALFPGHYQPRLPSDLGFYDLRVPEVREAQAALARQHGIEGFCYWHYWFHGRRLLERPFQEVLQSGRPDFPFCLAWANESWSRSWLGDKRDILADQRYSHDDDLAHARWLAAAFADSRYLRIHGRPLFLIYRPFALPDARATTDTLRSEIVRLGLPEPYLVGINAHNPDADMRKLGFDMTEHHEPQLGALPGAYAPASLDRRMRMKLRKTLGRPAKVYTYEEARAFMASKVPAHPHFPCLFVGWDNTARRGQEAIIMTDATPEIVGAHLRRLIRSLSSKHPQERILFINAWNEWAEGMYLEPDHRYGTALLAEVARSLQEAAQPADPQPQTTRA